MQFYNDIMTKGVLLVGLFINTQHATFPTYPVTHLPTYDI